MPLNAGGKLNIVASSDLGGLGAKDGSPILYTWVLPSVAPLLVPYLVILGLLTLKGNRRASAWLIWLPLGCVVGLTFLPMTSLLPGADFFLDAIAALGIGLTAVWLLSDSLRRQHRLVTFLCVLIALMGFSALAAVFKQGLSLMDIELLQIGVVLAFGVLATSVSLSLAGLLCRSRYRPLALYVWLLLLLAVVWLLISAPFFIFALIASGGSIPWSQFLGPVLAVAIGNYVLLLPFLILSSANPFYRKRLKALLNVKPDTMPETVPLSETNLTP